MVYVKEIEIAGRKLRLETGRLAKQATGSVLLQYGETVVLAAAVQSDKAREGVDFFPLTVDYEEKMYAAGKIKGSRFIKREGRATDDATITARVIDRSMRPLFKETERRDTQISVNVLAFDGENDADVLGIIAASAALSISGVAWNGPLAACRVGMVGEEIIFNPTYAQRKESKIDLVVSSHGDEAVMIDAEALEANEEITYKLIVAAVEENKKLEQFIADVVKELNVQPKAVSAKEVSAEEIEKQQAQELLSAKVLELTRANYKLVHGHRSKQDYKAGIAALLVTIDETLKADSAIDKDLRAQAPKHLEHALDIVMRERVLADNVRIDGRALDEIRPLAAEAGVLPRVHGSGLFTRGETQVLTVATLGAPGDEQTIDSMEENSTKRYMHHYNFPGFSVGEVKPLRSPGRREIGHGALAEKALEPVLPSKDDFPYTIRLVSEVLESNGSSSQASICGSTLALMDAGVPIKRPVAGLAMGLISNYADKNDYRIITDIQGIEDHSGDMDFKVGGTSEGITSIQLDIKLGGIGMNVVKETLEKARVARVKLLEVIAKAISSPRADLSKYAPRIETLRINPDKIRDLIGPGGKMINSIIDATGVQIDIEDDGRVFVTSTSADGMQQAKQLIDAVTKEVRPGEVYSGKVTRIMDFGAFVEVAPRQEGLVHVSEMAWERVNHPSDKVNVGDTVQVKVVEIDAMGRLNLSMKQLTAPPEGYNSHQGDGPRRR